MISLAVISATTTNPNHISNKKSIIDSLSPQKGTPVLLAKKVKSRPTVRMVNEYASRFWEQTAHAAKAIVRHNKARGQADIDPSVVSSLGTAVEKAIGALGLPKISKKQYHSKKQLALCLRSPPSIKSGPTAPIFEEVGGTRERQALPPRGAPRKSEHSKYSTWARARWGGAC